MKKAHISFRIGAKIWMSEERFLVLLDLFDKYRGVTDEITLFTAETHAPLPIDVYKKRVDIAKERMQVAKARGYSSGINILTTIGHHEEDLAHSLIGKYTPIEDIYGSICRGSFCPNDESFKTYIRSLYEMTAASNPDYIWIDDDVRLAGHMPITYTCFCDHCLAIFADEFGVSYSKDSIRKSFNEGTTEEKLGIRKNWLQHNRNTIGQLLRLIEQTVHNVNPNMPIGFMTGERFYEGYDFDQWEADLSGPNQANVMWRPGGGFYSDETVNELIQKSHQIGRQVSLLSKKVISIQSEIENFPYQVLKKSAKVTVLEAAAYIATGCTGAAFNIMTLDSSPLTEFEPLIRKIHESRGFYDRLTAIFNQCDPSGIYTSWGKNSFAALGIESEDWFTGYMSDVLQCSNELYEIGLPAAYSASYAAVTVVTKDSILGMEPANIMRMLANGVYMDAEALIHLNDLGYSEYTGCEVAGFVNEDCIEQYAAHPMNQGFVGQRRDGRQSFNKARSGMLKPLNTQVQILSSIVDYAGTEIASCGMSIFENKLGGRICVSGYYAWRFLQDLAKSTQIKRAMLWLSKDTLLAYIDSFHKINLWVRKLADGRLALACINTSLDEAEHVTLIVKTEGNEITIVDKSLTETRLYSTNTIGMYKSFKLPVLLTWEMYLIVT